MYRGFLIELGKFSKERQTATLTFFRVKLESINIVVLNAGDKINSIKSCCGHDRRIVRQNIVGMDKVKISLFGNG